LEISTTSSIALRQDLGDLNYQCSQLLGLSDVVRLNPIQALSELNQL
jgi:hypothetical protein